MDKKYAIDPSEYRLFIGAGPFEIKKHPDVYVHRSLENAYMWNYPMELPENAILCVMPKEIAMKEVYEEISKPNLEIVK